MEQTKTTRELVTDWFRAMDNDTFQHYALKYEHLIGEDRQITAAIKEVIYLSENPQTETKVEDVQPTEEIERHARLIENADAMYSALQAVNTCMTLDTPLAIETHKRILELLHKIDNK